MTSLQPPVYFFPALCSLTAVGTEITQHPQSITVGAGTDVQLTGAASGTNLTYQWRLNDADIPGANSPTLLLSNVQPTQAGSYKLFVSGDGGSALSNPAFVGVTIFPPVIVTQMPLITLAATGSPAEFVGGCKARHLSIFFGPEAENHFPVSTSPLTLPNVQKTNAGKYRVVVSNSAGQAMSRDTQLKVLIPPVCSSNRFRKPMRSARSPARQSKRKPQASISVVVQRRAHSGSH